MKKQVIVHFDVDGTLAEWKDLVPDVKKMLIKLGHDTNSIEQVMQVPEIVNEQVRKIISAPGYFYNLAPYENVTRFAALLVKKGYEVRINSCAIGRKAISDKSFWLSDFLPEVKNTAKHTRYVFVEDGRGDKKAEYIEDLKDPDTVHILIDDHTPNLIGFEECLQKAKANGCAIKMLNGINGKQFRWQGDLLSNDMSPKELFDAFKEIEERILANLEKEEPDMELEER